MVERDKDESQQTDIVSVAPVLSRLQFAVPSMSEESELIARAAKGDTAAFRALYQRHRSDVARLVYRMLSGSADVEDVVQEVFVQVYRSLKDFRGQSKFSTWVHRVAVNVVLMHRRAARSRPTYTEELPHDHTVDEHTVLPDEDAERRARVRVVRKACSRSSPTRSARSSFFTSSKASRRKRSPTIVGAPVLTVRTRLFYARRELEALMATEPRLAALRGTFAREKEEEP